MYLQVPSQDMKKLKSHQIQSKNGRISQNDHCKRLVDLPK